MTVRGIARGRIIELQEPLPYADGQEITVSVDSSAQLPPMGTPSRILKTIRSLPPADPAAADEFDRIIREAKRPGRPVAVFDDE